MTDGARFHCCGLEWRRAPTSRTAFFADVEGARLFVAQTVRSVRAFGIIGSEFQAMRDGVRIGEFFSLAKAIAVAISGHKKPAPQIAEPVGGCFDY